jgi:hypothetical protein
MYDEDNPAHVDGCRRLNDELRQSLGQPHCTKNKVMLTAGLIGLDDEFVVKAFAATNDGNVTDRHVGLSF